MKNSRSKYWTIILYEDSENILFNDKIDVLNKISNDLVYIKHDKDDKKIHYHIVLSFENYKWLNALSEETGIPINYFQSVKNLDSILCYLIHYKDNTKYNYDLSDVQGSLKLINKLKKNLNNYNKDEESKVYEILNHIFTNPSLNFSNLVKWVVENGYWSEFRRGSSIFIKILDEQNYIYYNKYRKGD